MTPDDPRHGTNAGYSAHHTDGTPPCFPCKVAKSNYWTRVNRARAYGRWEPWVDATEARDHVKQLMADGMSIKRIAAAANVLPTRVSHLLYGRGERAAPSKIRPDYSAALLGVEPNPYRVPILHVSRRIQALIAIGYPMTELSARLGMSQGRVWQYATEYQDRVTVDTFMAVDALFRKLSMTLPPRRTKEEKYAASRAMNTAKRRGYKPPLAWHDIDDPRERPLKYTNHARKTDIDPVVVERLIAGDRIPSTNAEKNEAMRRWKAAGRSEKSLCDIHGWHDNRYGKDAA